MGKKAYLIEYVLAQPASYSNQRFKYEIVTGISEESGLLHNQISFGPSWSFYPGKGPIQGHWLVFFEDHHGFKDVEAIEHDVSKLRETTYNLARKLAQKLAKDEGIEFVDLTSRAKPSQLEASAQTQP